MFIKSFDSCLQFVSLRLTLLPYFWSRKRCCSEVRQFFLRFDLIFDRNHPHPSAAAMCTAESEKICKYGTVSIYIECVDQSK